MRLRLFVFLSLVLATGSYAAEDLSHITGAGGIVYFAHDFESGVLTPDDGSGTWSTLGGNVNGDPGPTGCDNTSTYHNTILSGTGAALGAVSGSAQSLMTPYRGACPNESTSRDMTSIGLPTPISEYYIRWYQKWTGSFQNSQQQKLIKFYNAADTQQTTETAYMVMEAAGSGATTGTLAGHFVNIDGYFNKLGSEFDPDYEGAYTPDDGLIWIHPIQNSLTESYYNGRPESWDTDATTTTKLAFNLNQWYLIEIHSKLNTPVESSNGVYEMWIDGVLRMKMDNMRFRDGGTYNSPGTNLFELQHVYYNRSASDQSTYMDNIVIADRRIGPLDAESDTTAPATAITEASPVATSVSTTTLTGTSSDAVGVSGCKWRLTSAPDAINGTACTGTTSFSCAVTGLSVGANTAYVGCYDAAGNYGSDSIMVNYAPPVTNITGGTITGCTILN